MAVVLYKYFVEKTNFEVVYKPACPQGRLHYKKHYASCDVMPQVDHIIFIDDKGLYKRNKTYLQKLKKSCRGSICVVCEKDRYWAGEDKLFCMSTKPILDEAMYVPNKDKIIRVMIDTVERPYVDMNRPKFVRSTPNILLEKLGKDPNITVVKMPQNYMQQIEEFKKAHIYFITAPDVDEILLTELALANVLVVSHKKFVNKRLVDKYGIVTYESDIVVGDLIKKLEGFNSRSKLLGHLESSIEQFYEFFNSDKNNNIREICENNSNKLDKLKTYKPAPFYSFVKKILRSRPPKEVPKEDVPKRRLLLQSNLGMFNKTD
jgi:hypothetical protein